MHEKRSLLGVHYAQGCPATAQTGWRHKMINKKRRGLHAPRLFDGRTPFLGETEISKVLTTYKIWGQKPKNTENKHDDRLTFETKYGCLRRQNSASGPFTSFSKDIYPFYRAPNVNKKIWTFSLICHVLFHSNQK